jgi:flavorubredoxin
MEPVTRPHPDIHALLSNVALPAGMGFLPVNAYLLMAKEPVLVDTGLGLESPLFLDALRGVIDPAEIRWLWLTHDDADHTGSLQQVLELAPNARLVCNAFVAFRQATAWQVPFHRLYAINPGESLDVGDRKLTAATPPLFDNPLSTGLRDDKTGAFFSVDSFGAIVPSIAEKAEDVPEEALKAGMVGWATSDSPWAHMVDKAKYGQALERVRQLNPTLILSSHLPPAGGSNIDAFLKVLASVPDAEPFRAPNQAELEQILASMAGPPA